MTLKEIAEVAPLCELLYEIDPNAHYVMRISERLPVEQFRRFQEALNRAWPGPGKVLVVDQNFSLFEISPESLEDRISKRLEAFEDLLLAWGVESANTIRKRRSERAENSNGLLSTEQVRNQETLNPLTSSETTS